MSYSLSSAKCQPQRSVLRLLQGALFWPLRIGIHKST